MCIHVVNIFFYNLKKVKMQMSKCQNMLTNVIKTVSCSDFIQFTKFEISQYKLKLLLLLADLCKIHKNDIRKSKLLGKLSTNKLEPKLYT